MVCRRWCQDHSREQNQQHPRHSTAEGKCARVFVTYNKQNRNVEPDATANLSNKPRRTRTDTTEAKIVSGMPKEEITNIQYTHKNLFWCIEKKTIASLC